MRKRLREVPEQFPSIHIYLFRVKAKVVDIATLALIIDLINIDVHIV